MTKHLDDSWKKWVKENLDNGISKNEILKILTEHNFDINESKKILDFDNINFFNFDVNIFKSIPNIKKIHDTFNIYELENFINLDICEKACELIRKTSAKSTVGSDVKDASYDLSRTSHTSFFLDKDVDFKVIYFIEDKIHDLLNIKLNFGEPIQGQWYKIGQEFKQHFDAFPSDKDTVANYGNRTFTAMIYLNNVEEGGFTSFPNINISLKPEAGKLVIWQNTLNSEIIKESSHVGEPVVKGEKFILTKWFREKEWPIYRKEKNEAN